MSHLRNTLSRLAVAALMGGTAVVLGGCPDSASALHVEELEGLTVTAGSATAPGTCIPSGTAKSAGAIDISRGDCCGYTIGAELINDLLTQTDTNTPPLVVDQHNVTITDVKVTYQFVPTSGSPSVTLPEATIPIGGTVLESGGGTGTFLATILPLSVGKALHPSGGTPATGGLVATMTFEGSDAAGDKIATQPINFPITVCDGCLATLSCMDGIQSCTPDSVDQDDGAICNSSM